MRTALVGYTGFVGSNIAKNYHFDRVYNSKNIEESFGTNPDLLVFAGIRAEKFLANSEPEKDFDIIEKAIANIKKINPKQLVLISTIDVYKKPVNVTEDTEIDTAHLQAYGANRYYLEQALREIYREMVVMRLPGLFGDNLKKNFIYDYLNVIPGMLRIEKLAELRSQIPNLDNFYYQISDQFFKCRALTEDEKKFLKEQFQSSSFSALNFTDSRGVFQFYDLSWLWFHIEKALENNIKVLNLATEPIQIEELYYELSGKEFINELNGEPPYYDFRTKHTDILGGQNGYLFDKNQVILQIKEYIQKQSQRN